MLVELDRFDGRLGNVGHLRPRYGRFALVKVGELKIQKETLTLVTKQLLSSEVQSKAD